MFWILFIQDSMWCHVMSCDVMWHELRIIHFNTWYLSTDGDRIKKCTTFLPILKSKTSIKTSGRATSFVSVSTICKIMILLICSRHRVTEEIVLLLFSLLQFLFFNVSFYFFFSTKFLWFFYSLRFCLLLFFCQLKYWSEWLS